MTGADWADPDALAISLYDVTAEPRGEESRQCPPIRSWPGWA